MQQFTAANKERINHLDTVVGQGELPVSAALKQLIG